MREQPVVDPKPPRSGRSAYAQGFLNNVLNPKPALFYLAFVPQFIEPGDPVFLMTGLLVSLHIVISIVWLVLWGWMIGRAAGALTRPRWRASARTGHRLRARRARRETRDDEPVGPAVSRGLFPPSRPAP